MPEFKFCGLTRPEDAAAATRLGASYAGVIFAGGPREISAERAAEVWGAVATSTERVGVFGADFRRRIPAVAAIADFHVAQLHGDPTPADVLAAREAFSGRIWATVRVAGNDLPPRFSELLGVADAVLLDPRVDGQLGGTGVALDWNGLAPAVDRGRRAGGRVILAGGLNPVNVVTAIAAIRPDVVDVSSGVESAPGVKDHERMAAFAEAVRGSGR